MTASWSVCRPDFSFETSDTNGTLSGVRISKLSTSCRATMRISYPSGLALQVVYIAQDMLGNETSNVLFERMGVEYGEVVFHRSYGE